MWQEAGVLRVRQEQKEKLHSLQAQVESKLRNAQERLTKQEEEQKERLVQHVSPPSIVNGQPIFVVSELIKSI